MESGGETKIRVAIFDPQFYCSSQMPQNPHHNHNLPFVPHQLFRKQGIEIRSIWLTLLIDGSFKRI